MSNRWDVSIDGMDLIVVPGEGYEQGATRAMVDFQEIETQSGTQLASRGDLRTLFQTSWAGGSAWERPIIDQNSVTSYFISDGFDPLREPGSLYPQATRVDLNDSGLENHSKWVQTDYRTAYSVGDDGGTYHDVERWRDGVITTISETSRIPNADVPIDLAFDGTDLFHLSDNRVSFTTIGSTQGEVTTAITGTYGSTIFIHEGELHVWDSDTLQKILTPKGTPAISEVFDDGNGIDWLDSIASPAAPWVHKWSMRNALSTSDGIFLVKNELQAGSVVPYITRVDRDSQGNVIGTPIATLNPGSVVIDLMWHMGNLFIAATSDLGRLGTNDSSLLGAPRVLFHVWNGQSLGTLSSARGNDPDEMVFKMIISDQEKLLIGGTKRLWVYDSVRGGVHPMFEVAQTEGHMHSGFTAAAGPFIGHGGNTGSGDLYHMPYSGQVDSGESYDIESNYVGFSLPGETKSVLEVELLTDGIKANETWQLFLTPDDGAEGSAASWTSADPNASLKTITPVVGTRFTYRLNYANSANITSPSKVKGIVMRGLSGRMVPYWKLIIDGTQGSNVLGKVMRAKDIFDHFLALRLKEETITFIDRYESFDRSDITTYVVRVASVLIQKDDPNESRIEIVLVGAP